MRYKLVWNSARWALFALGVIKLSVVLTESPLISVAIAILISLLFVTYLRKAEDQGGVFKECIAAPFIYLIFALAYDSIVLLSIESAIIIFEILLAISFYLGAFATTYVIKVKHDTP
jgi:hypothetical protein